MLVSNEIYYKKKELVSNIQMRKMKYKVSLASHLILLNKKRKKR